MSHPLDDPATLVDHVIRTTGGGRVLCAGPAAAALVSAFRARAVDATAWTWAVDDASRPLLEPSIHDTFDLVVLDRVLDGLAPEAQAALVDRALQLTTGVLLLRADGRRETWESELLARGCRKYPLHQLLIPYGGLDWEGPVATVLVERLPAHAEIGRSAWELAATRDLHMDMLREAGCRADAHVARYMFARQFIRPGDRVVDAACGMGYGSAILHDGTLAESVEGIDADVYAVDYAVAHYGRDRSRLYFAAADVAALSSRPAASVDAIVSFETIEHLARPDEFLAECRRLLTPGGRLICSVPNEWLNEQGVDPNPHHLHVFNRERLERACREHFFIEQVYGQTAGKGMKLRDAGRRLWAARPDETDAEWWLLVGMTPPVAANAGPVRHGLTSRPVADATNVLAFDRDYLEPWLVRAMVTIGLRTESSELLERFAACTLASAPADSADAGAALCVRAYRHLEAGTRLPDDLLARMTTYCDAASENAHVRRWQISLCYVEGLSWMQQGDLQSATAAFEACAAADALTFSPLLATKTVGSAFLLGWIALQARNLERAARCWTHGVNAAEEALHRPWQEFLLDRTSPALFGLREATTIVDLASQCATGLALLEQARERPGVVAAQLFESLQARLNRTSQAPAVARDAPGRADQASHGIESPEDLQPAFDFQTPDAAAPAAAPQPLRWRLLDHLEEARLVEGEANQLAAWDAEIDGQYTRSVFLHPPAVLEATIPDGSSGRLSARVALHPEAWGREGATACQFVATVDGLAQASVLVDPHTLPAHRHWIDLTIDVPAATDRQHVLTLETRSLDAPDYGWALFDRVTFEASEIAPRPAVDREPSVAPPAADEPAATRVA